jgi:molybdenum cofactor guanylyltransferase
VLAGGRSTRFGSDKLVARYRGIPLVHHAILRLSDVCGVVVVVVGPGTSVLQFPSDVTVRVARDAADAQGPLAGLLAGLEHVDSELALAAGGDMPELAVSVLRSMLGLAAGDRSIDAVALLDRERVSPLPIVVRAEAARVAARDLLAGGDRRLGSLLGALRTRVIDESVWLALDPLGGTLRDVDVPADLATPPESV